MFNFGSDDKEELQENMQEIKGMIQGDKNKNRQSDSGFDSFDGFDQDSSGHDRNSSQGFNQNTGQDMNQGFSGGNGNQNMDTQNRQGKDDTPDFGGGDQESFTENQNQGQIAQEQDEFDPFAPSDEDQTESQVGQRVKVPGQTESTTQISDGNNNENMDRGSQEQESEKESSNSKARNISRSSSIGSKDNRPSADEPLFLREENFVDVREMIEEMGYLARELQENLDEMKETVHKEKEYARDAQEVVNAYSDRRGDIEDIIETGQK